MDVAWRRGATCLNAVGKCVGKGKPKVFHGSCNLCGQRRRRALACPGKGGIACEHYGQVGLRLSKGWSRGLGKQGWHNPSGRQRGVEGKTRVGVVCACLWGTGGMCRSHPCPCRQPR